MASTIYVMLFAVVIFYVIPSLKKYRKEKRLKHLQFNDPDLLFEEIDKELEQKSNKESREIWLLYKSSVLIQVGRWEEAQHIMDSIDVEKLPAYRRIEFHLMYVSSLFYSGKTDEAKRHLELYQEEIYNEGSNKLKPIIARTFALKELYSGNVEDSKKMLEGILPILDNPYTNSVTYYYLGVVCCKLGDYSNSIIYLNKAKEFGRNTFVINKSDQLINVINEAKLNS